ncbi:DNA-binding protein YbiB [Undibacterium sp. FT79W]|uniref:DNA-binding protein YbiB n=1 Tax=Undibacterium sp. FT79W TaxID=2762296 RepID=UPI00164C0C9F|nr:DNA-binding protein YbiB [Undibacterium sp. FT79W]MBC3878463.1 DNA-binding protein YbiB [Undibacterium sp. FT79W]
MTDDLTQTVATAFPAARFIKEIGRGKDGARSMSSEDAASLYTAMLNGRVSDLELGAILLAMRIKGESIDEIAGFLHAARPFMLALEAPLSNNYVPVLIPSYNGARKKANLTPLLAILLARRGVPVVVHGVSHDPGRVTTAEIFSALNFPVCSNASDVSLEMSLSRPAFIPVELLAPALARLLALRKILGVRNSTHTLVKLLQPFTTPALRLTSYTHPEYQQMLQHYFSQRAPHEAGDVFLMRGTEGETVASTGRAQQIDWIHEGEVTTLAHTQSVIVGEVENIPEQFDAATTAAWIQRVLNDEIPVPVNIAAQVEHCVLVSRLIHQRLVR